MGRGWGGGEALSPLMPSTALVPIFSLVHRQKTMKDVIELLVKTPLHDDHILRLSL